MFAGGGAQEVGEATVAWRLDAERAAVAAVASMFEGFAAALDVPVVRDELAAGGADDLLARDELARNRERGILGILGRDPTVEREPHRVGVPVVHRCFRRPKRALESQVDLDYAARASDGRCSFARRKRRAIAANCRVRSSSASAADGGWIVNVTVSSSWVSVSDSRV